MAVSSAAVNNVRESFDRCLKQPNFIENFYQKLFTYDAGIQPKFSNTLFTVQKALVTNGLKKLLAYAEGDAAAQGELDLIKKSHAKSQMDIKPEWYAHFISALIATAKEMDPSYSPSLDGDYKAAMQPGIDIIKSGYFEGAA